MEFVKKWKRGYRGNNERLHPEDTTGSYEKLSDHNKNKENDLKKKKKKVPHGCVSVYVGAERQRFVIKIKMANHPLFMTLLDAAENEYGYRNDGPLWLPCDVDLFCETLAEMEREH